MSDLTIRDIAKLAGVSTTAVSFVLNNRPGVSDATRQRIQEVIERTGFTPNIHTRRLNLGHSFTIHVVLRWYQYDLFNQFALEILHGVFLACKELAYNVLFTFVEEKMDSSQLMNSIRSKDCDGVILIQIEDPLILSLLQQEHIPFICVDSHVVRDGSVPLVEVDYCKASYLAVMYLQRMGHKKIGFISPTTPSELHLSTFTGYTNALRDCSLTCDPAWIGNISFTADAAGRFFDYLMRSGRLPTAFLCAGDVFAIDLIQTMKKHNLQIPRDMSVIGIDDLLVSRYLDPPLTTMSFQKEELGRRAVNVLYQIINGKSFEAVNLVPAEIVERSSVSCIRSATVQNH